MAEYVSENQDLFCLVPCREQGLVWRWILTLNTKCIPILVQQNERNHISHLRINYIVTFLQATSVFLP